MPVSSHTGCPPAVRGPSPSIGMESPSPPACRGTRVSGLQPASPGGAELRPDLAHVAETTHILRVKNRTGTCTTARRVCRFCASCGTRWWRRSGGTRDHVSHGRGLFPRRCVPLTPRGGGNRCYPGALLRLVGSVGRNPAPADLDAGDIRRERLRVARGDCPVSCCTVSDLSISKNRVFQLLCRFESGDFT